MGDFLPKSIFLNEIWVKNRPFLYFHHYFFSSYSSKKLRYASSQPWVGKIAMGGHSQGGVVTAMTSGQLAKEANKEIKKIQAVVLLAPAAVLRDDADHGFGGQEEQTAHIASDFLAKVLK